jgi:hypothetical protein
MRPSGGRGSWRRSEPRPKCLGRLLLKDCDGASSRAEEVKIDRKSSRRAALAPGRDAALAGGASPLIRQAKPIADRQFEIEFLDSGVDAFAFTFG